MRTVNFKEMGASPTNTSINGWNQSEPQKLPPQTPNTGFALAVMLKQMLVSGLLSVYLCELQAKQSGVYTGQPELETVQW